MSENEDHDDELGAIEELLPWYAAGTLDAAATRRVEAALAREPKLQTSLRLAREDRDETIMLNERLGAPDAQAWARVMAVAQAEPRALAPANWLAALASRTVAWASAAPSRLAWAGAAAVVVIVLQGAAIVALLPRAAGPAYDTASQQGPLAEGATVIVGFAPDVTLQQVAAMLQKYKASIVDGPRGGGFYRVRIGAKTMAKEQRESVLAALGAEPIVRIALPAPTQ
jgi:hypothetical protein